MKNIKNNEKQSVGQKLHQTVLLVLLAVVSITAATYAWFSLSANTRVRSMNLEITTGVSLKFDTSAHTSFDDYIKTMSFDKIYEQLRASYGYDPKTAAIEPVTTQNGTSFQTQKGAEVLPDTGKYYEFTLHFMATKDMTVHLTSANTSGKEDGTLVQSGTGAARAIRISFTAEEKTSIYQPQGASNGTFTLDTAAQMQYNNDNALFAVKANTDMPVVVRIWLEGTDASCTDELRNADYSIRMRFAGTDENGNVFE